MPKPLKPSSRKSPEENVLLSRERFKEAVLARARGQCVFCTAPAVDAHHILERKLFSNGGYYLGNGAAVCADCHWQCETTTRSVEAVRRAARITSTILPPDFDIDLVYDKWGNIVQQDGTLIAGPLVDDAGMQRALGQGGKLGLLLRGTWL